jgi:hypothetical protein
LSCLGTGKTDDDGKESSFEVKKVTASSSANTAAPKSNSDGKEYKILNSEDIRRHRLSPNTSTQTKIYGSKTIILTRQLRQALLKGVYKLAQAVSATLGPKGRNVVLDKKFGSPTVTKDGVTVAKEIELKIPYENMGAQMVREVASKTSDAAGDGTTTATVLAEAIYREGLKYVTCRRKPDRHPARHQQGS